LSADTSVVFRVEGLAKSFGGFKALNGVDLALGPGEVRAVIGPNGAGKTTLVNVVSGLLRPSAGRIFLAGENITGASAQRRARLGLSRTFQITSLFRGLTVAEHLTLAFRGTEAGRRAVGGEELLDDLGLGPMRERKVETLSHGDQRILEVAMGLAARPKLLLLDEPTAGMSVVETAAMIGLINRRLRGRVSVIVIEHDMNVVMKTADRITVMSNGGVIAEGPPRDILGDPRVKEVYLGSAVGP
jgi:branched-chain amino acid transport system ATP-binding protein